MCAHNLPSVGPSSTESWEKMSAAPTICSSISGYVTPLNADCEDGCFQIPRPDSRISKYTHHDFVYPKNRHRPVSFGE